MDNNKKVYCHNCKFKNRMLWQNTICSSPTFCCYEKTTIVDNHYHKKCKCVDICQADMSIKNKNNNCNDYRRKWYKIFS